MVFEEYGKENSDIMFMLHGLHNVYAFREQYTLKSKYHIMVPNLLGFGERTDEIFETGSQISEIVDYLSSLEKNVILVGFSLGAALAFKLVSEYENFFKRVVLVSPCLLWDENLSKKYTEGALKGLKFLKNKIFVKLLCFLNGIPKKYRLKMAEQIPKVQENTVINAINCGIDFDSVKGFSEVSIPVTVFCGEKEPDVTKNSCRKLCEINKNCELKLVKSAAHNIPTKFCEQFNKFLLEL